MPTVLALFMIAIVAAAAFFGFLFVQTKLDHDKILEHVTVAGVDVGGMTTQEAADAIRNATAHTYGKQALEFTIGENKYTVQNEWQADTKLPAGFEAIEYSLNDENIAALKSAGGTILVYAADESGNNSFVIYDEENGEYSEFRAVEYEQKSYILTERDRTSPVPTDFFPSKKEIDGEMTEIWTNQNGDVLIFAIDTDGNRGYFLYDEESGKIEFFASEPVPESTASSEPEQINWLENLKSDKELLFKIVVIEAGVILLLLILFIIFLCLYLNKGKKDDNDDNYYYDQNDGFDDYDDFGGEDYIDESSGAEIVGNTDEEFSGEISDDFKQLFDVVE